MFAALAWLCWLHTRVSILGAGPVKDQPGPRWFLQTELGKCQHTAHVQLVGSKTVQEGDCC